MHLKFLPLSLSVFFFFPLSQHHRRLRAVGKLYAPDRSSIDDQALFVVLIY